MWDGVPTDGSVVCQSPNVQTTVGFVQGGKQPNDCLLLAQKQLKPYFKQTH